MDSVVALQQHLNLATAYLHTGDDSAAVAHLTSASYLIGLISGHNNPELSNILTQVAQALTKSGNYSSAISCLLEVKDRFQAVNDQVKIAAVLQSIADISLEQNNDKSVSEATAYQKRAYVMLRNMYGESDEQTQAAKQKCESILRANHTKQVDQLRKQQQEESAKKEKERLKWLVDMDSSEDEGDEKGVNKKSSGKKKKSKKSKK